ncbi:dispersed gene family protein 1 (DGF-1), putative, partial [Trypanosoma cruzi marinkellei]
VDGEVNAGLGTSLACYVGVTFSADVVVDVASMSGSVRNVTLVNCTFLGRASLYVVGWLSDPPAGERADVLISGLEVRSGGGVVVANRYPPGSRVTVVDSVLIAEKRVAYRDAYDLGDVSACLVVHNVNLTGSVLTIARTQVAAVFRDAVGVLLVGGVALSSRGALYMEELSVQTALELCVSVEGGVAASGGSVVAFVDSDFLLVGVTFSADVVVDVASMSGSVRNVTLVNCTFLGRASLYVVGWLSDPPAGERADVLISGLEVRSGGGVVVANRYPPGSRVTVVDSVLIAEKRVAYRDAYDLGDVSACLVVHNVNLTGSVLTIARTQVAAVFRDAVGVLLVGGVALSSRGALYMEELSVQTALELCVSVEGGVAASGGSVVAFVDS